ncbi:DUF397 domain-containing protein [Nonomuraea fuscirosea]|uniref:DUF397 domain-containing protein n=1 Tax=Nonomuraea fuscirosea TaxID=1291556 RepID=UPI003798D67E
MEEPLIWRRSSFCWDGDCIEAAIIRDGYIAIRDSKSPTSGPVVCSAWDFEQLIERIRSEAV